MAIFDDSFLEACFGNEAPALTDESVVTAEKELGLGTYDGRLEYGSISVVLSSLEKMQRLCIHSICEFERAKQRTDVDSPDFVYLGMDGNFSAAGAKKLLKDISTFKRVSPVLRVYTVPSPSTGFDSVGESSAESDELCHPHLIYARAVTDPEQFVDAVSTSKRTFVISSTGQLRSADEYSPTLYTDAAVLDAILEGLVTRHPFYLCFKVFSGASDDTSPDAAAFGLYRASRMITYQE